MKKSDRIELATLITGMAELYNKTLSETAITIYITALEKYPIEEIKPAINNIVTQRVYAKFPLPAEFIEYINPSGNLEARALIAVEEVLNKNEIQGPTMTVSFDDPIIHHVILRYGGWHKIGSKLREIHADKYSLRQMSFWRKEFAEMYCFFARQPQLKAPPRKLIGSMDAENIALGFLDKDTGQLKLPDGSLKQIDIGQNDNKLLGCKNE